jgi:serine/threonine-protein kinase
MGVVFKARQRGLNRVVALKMILASHLATPDHVSRFQREARATAKVTHTNVIGVFDVGEVEGQYYFAMEYIGGCTLAEQMQRDRFTPEKAARLVACLARAVAHVHRQGIVHRDLKPANVLLTTDGVPKIADFGLARALDDSEGSTRTGVILGTPAYMSPEQAAGQLRKVGPHSDVYSLGAILYEMLTGRPPFRSESALHTILQVLENEPEPPRRLNPAIPRDLELICLKCLEKNIEQRYASAEALADDLERMLDQEPISARPDTLLQSARRWFRRDPILVTRLLGLVLGALVLQVNYFLRDDIQPGYHLQVMVVIGLWMVGTVLCKRLLRTDPDDVRAVDAGRLLWIGLDIIGMTWVILLGDNEGGPLVVSFALMVTLSGLWFRLHLVWITTVLCELAYLTIIFKVYLTTGTIPSKHWVVTFMVMLALVGAVVAWQVQRVLFLSRRWLER